MLNVIWIILILMAVHWIADFVLQSHWQATNKSKNNRALTMHVLTYSYCWAVFLLLVAYKVNINVMQISEFVLITGIAHWITDYCTSRIVSRFFAKEDYHNGFVVIGIDQMLHYAQIFLTLWWTILS